MAFKNRFALVYKLHALLMAGLVTVVQSPQILLRVYRVASTPRYKLCIRRNEQGNLTTFFAGQLGTWDAHARAQLDEPLSPEVLEVGKGDGWGALFEMNDRLTMVGATY